jgi:hypothetical protein
MLPFSGECGHLRIRFNHATILSSSVTFASFLILFARNEMTATFSLV